MGRALAHRNFRLFTVGQGISVVGTWMQQIATVWLVYRLSDSAFLLGLADFASQIPAALVLPLAGVLTDRWNRHRTVLATQALAMVQAFVLMALTLTGVVSVWQVILLGALLGLVNAFDATARQSFVIQMVERHEDLANAIAINSSVFNAARLLGPAVAGFVIGLCGEWPCFLLNGLSYLAVLGSLLAMRVRPIVQAGRRPGDRRGAQRGLRVRGRFDAHPHAAGPAGHREHDVRAADGAHAARWPPRSCTAARTRWACSRPPWASAPWRPACFWPPARASSGWEE